MKAIIVTSWGSLPQFTASTPQPPKPTSPETVQLKVLASGLPQLVRSQASGKHYTTTNATLPYIPGADGVGLDDSTGQLLYFNSINSGGGFANYINVPRRATFPVPTPPSSTSTQKKITAITIASLMNPAMSSWMALTTRTTSLQPGFTVLIMGATSLSGKIAINLSRALGASKVIGVARSASQLSNLNLDVSLTLNSPIESTDFKSLFNQHKVDVILDYIYGPATLHLFNSIPSNAVTAHENEIQYIQIGSLGGEQEISLPSAILRSKNITIRGAGPGSWSVTKNVAEQYPILLQKMVDGVVGEFDVREKKLEDVEEVWDSRDRTVFVMGD